MLGSPPRRVYVSQTKQTAELLLEAREWADAFRDNDLSWDEHGDHLAEAADLIDSLLALVAETLAAFGCT